MVRDIGASDARFKVAPRGGYFANSTADLNGFETKTPIYQVPLNKEDILPIGRPLWVRETGQTGKESKSKKIIKEKTPAGAQYSVKREFDDPMKNVNNPDRCVFGLSYKELKKVSSFLIFIHLTICLYRTANSTPDIKTSTTHRTSTMLVL